MVTVAVKPLTSTPPEPLSNLKLPGARNSGVTGMNGGRPPPTTLLIILYSVFAPWFWFLGSCLAPAGPVILRAGPASKNWYGTCPLGRESTPGKKAPKKVPSELKGSARQPEEGTARFPTGAMAARTPSGGPE